MKKLISIFLFGLLTVFLSFTVEPASAAMPSFVDDTASAANSSVNDAATVVKRISLRQISNRETLNLRGVDGSEAMSLGAKRDELITRAVLHLRYTYSPALLPGESHLKIIINDEVIQVLPVTKENVGHSVTQDIEIDPRWFTNVTRMKFQLIGHYTHDCEDPMHTSLWTEISGASQLELTVRQLTLKNDLALLPEPFFNERDFNTQLNVPFIFPTAPSKQTLTAAGIVSSWFGKLAAWRGARFPAKINTISAGHAVVFVSNEQRPSFLVNHPNIDGPGLEMITNPIDQRSKLLLILGRNGEDQKIAAQALVLGNAALAGSRVDVKNLQAEPPRKAYDAPNWVRMDRPMKFGELVSSAQMLQVEGYDPPVINIPMRIPPDLFTWRTRGVPIDLKFRYTPPQRVSESRLRMSINDELVKSFPLLPSGEISKSRIRLPLIDDMLFGESQELLLPGFKLKARNDLQFKFFTVPQKESVCSDSIAQNVRNMVDADSKIDFSDYPHYTEMPNLGYFATAGFPFTKYADLSQTMVVLPELPSAFDIETMLTLLGRMGESTGYPATQFGIANTAEASSLKDVDLLVIGASLKQGLLAQWSDKLPVSLSKGMLRSSQPTRSVNQVMDWLNFEMTPDPSVMAQQQFDHNGNLAAILGFESPVSSKRSVVAFVSTQPEGITQTLDALERSSSDIYGSAVFIHPNKVQGFLVGDIYTIGQLPFWLSIWYPFANHPVLLAILAALAVLVFAFALWRTLRLLAAKRLRVGETEEE